MAKKAPRPYFIVAARQPGAFWGVAFGDYEKEVADQEMFDQAEDAKREPKATRDTFKLVRIATDDQPAIDAAIEKLNAALAAPLFA